MMKWIVYLLYHLRWGIWVEVFPKMERYIKDGGKKNKKNPDFRLGLTAGVSFFLDFLNSFYILKCSGGDFGFDGRNP